ncbi:unnamed protein product [Calicophoron daubneyi]|uniref:Trematode PH-like domain-containing protein n=1 Tax=Calicophoron daubneyi TaxID=300641 RepID=A0AAV2TI11_CALDB
MSRKSRGETGPPLGSQYIDGELVHTATNQKLYHRLQVCTCYRSTLKDKDSLSREQAAKILEKSLSKRQAHGFVNLLEDRFTLEKSKTGGREPFRTWLGYGEITDFQRSSTKPEFFVISIQSAKSSKKYYEVYKCKSADDAQKFESIVVQALADPEHVVRNRRAIDTMEVREDDDRIRSMAHLEFQTSLESLEEDHRTSSMYQLTSPTPPEGYEYLERELSDPVPQPAYRETYVRATPPHSPTPPLKIRTPSPVLIRQTVEPVRAMAIKASPSTLKGVDGVTYIKFDSRTNEPVIADEGPVYMYLCREERSLPQGDYGRNYKTKFGDRIEPY